MIHEFLKEERKRLGYNQEGFAEIAGVSRRAYTEWESGKTSPTAVHLAKLAAAGADVFYILTGQHGGPLSSDEASLLDHYRHSSKKGKDAVRQAAFAFAEQIMKKKAA